jgi:hypothetical protein
VKAHTQREYGNAWVDCRAKSGRHGFSGRNLPPDNFLADALSLVLQNLSGNSMVPPLDTDTFLDEEESSQLDTMAVDQRESMEGSDSREPCSDFASVMGIIDHLPAEIDFLDEEVVDHLLSSSSEQGYPNIPTSIENAQSSMTEGGWLDEIL